MAKATGRNRPEESKSDRFKRVVTPRVNKALKAISLVGNQSGAAYEYTPKEIITIVTALTAAVRAVQDQFNAQGKADAGFKL